MNVPSASEYVCHGVTWATGQPQLLLAHVTSGSLEHAEIMNRRLGLRTTSAGRFCTGRYRFVETFHVEPVACPDRAPAEQSGQCGQCARQDEFRSAHQFHHGGHAPPALVRYMSQPHWLYVASFAHGASKVGTAAEPRKRSRLDEQGALFATYLAKSADGRAVRHLEDAVTRQLGVTQTVRGAAKLAALADLSTLDEAQAAHERTVQRAAELLASLGVDPVLEAWHAPSEGDRLRTRRREGERALYPHDLRKGEHGFTVKSCIGSQVLACLTGPDDSMRYVLDLAVLKGRRLVFGDFSSPEAVVQASLF